MSYAKAFAQVSVLLLSILMFTVNPISADNHGNTIVIDEIMEWTNEQEISESIYITSNGELTISNSITFTTESLITIDEGGKLNLIGQAEIISDKRATSLKTMGLIDENNRSTIIVPTSGYSEELRILINSEEGALLNGSHVYVGSMDPVEMNGEVFVIEIPEGEYETQLGFTGYGHFPIIKSIVLESIAGDIISEHLANELPNQNMLLYGENGVRVESAGTIDISDNSMIKGLDIYSSGDIIIKNGIIRDSFPIKLTSDQSMITIENTEFSGSLEDHYIQAQPYSVINWGISEDGEDVSIKGLLIDRWERIITDQSLIFDTIGVHYRIIGNSPEGILDMNNYSGNDGISYINGGKARVIEIGWANGLITRENANIEIIEYRTAWNMEVSGIDNYGPSTTLLTWEKEIDMTSNKPIIEWVALNLVSNEETANTGSPLQISATLANRGTESANLFFDCSIIETGLAADIGGYQNLKIDPNEQVEVYFSWRNNDPGEFSLKCTILTPTQLVNYETSDAFGGGDMSTKLITWEESEETSGLTILPILISIMIIVMAGGVYLVHHLSNDAEETAEILEDFNRDTIEDEDEEVELDV
ncbi:MAG: hypothetical protein NLN66_01320 [Candidatus Thalassarchaeaceae archaeon]|nr:hypothetical protein [Candidatus Thalassarchaeaceae archaeon]